MFEAWNLREVLECLELGVDVTPLPLLYILTAGQLTQVNGFRRRIYTEEKAKVVADAWGTELLQFLAALAILHQDDLNNSMI